MSERWYVVADDDAGAAYLGDPDMQIWTVSKHPRECGWETDGGFPGYGLTRADAEFLATAANEKIDRDRHK